MSTALRIHRGKIASDQRGAALVEFAFVAPIMCMIILGFLEFAHWNYVRAAATGAVEEVARAASVGGAGVNPRIGEQRAEAIINQIAIGTEYTWTKKSYFQFSSVGRPEKLTDDKNRNGAYDRGDCWEDASPNGRFDQERGAEGVGGADDVVVYELTVDYEPIVGLSRLLPVVPSERSATVKTMVKRQPFASQGAPVIRC